VPHNEFLNVGAMMGLLGFVLYLRVFSAMFGALRAIWQRPDVPRFTQATAVYACAIWIGWCVNACFADFANLGYVNVLLYFAAGMAVALAEGPPQTGLEP
jgi:O-antigen ligase